MTDTIADTAKIVHGAMVHAVREFKGEPQPWQNGNSFAEAYARRAARDILGLTPNASMPAELVERVIETARDYERGLHLERRFGASWDELEKAKHELLAAIPPAGRMEEALAILNDSSMPTPDRVRFARAALKAGTTK